MDDILKLFADMVVDIQGFNDSHFGIFHPDEHQDLVHMWFHEAKKNPNAFISMLSPAQKKLVAVWATQRSSYSTVVLVEILEKFTTFLKTITNPVYPISRSQTISTIKRSSRNKSTAGPKGWKKLIYTSKEIQNVSK